MHSGSGGVKEKSWKIHRERSGEIKVGFYGRIFGRILDVLGSSSLETDFGLSVVSIGRGTWAVFVNAQVPVRGASSGRTSRNFRSAWWSDFFEESCVFYLSSFGDGFLSTDNFGLDMFSR